MISKTSANILKFSLQLRKNIEEAHWIDVEYGKHYQSARLFLAIRVGSSHLHSVFCLIVFPITKFSDISLHYIASHSLPQGAPYSFPTIPSFLSNSIQLYPVPLYCVPFIPTCFILPLSIIFHFISFSFFLIPPLLTLSCPVPLHLIPALGSSEGFFPPQIRMSVFPGMLFLKSKVTVMRVLSTVVYLGKTID